MNFVGSPLVVGTNVLVLGRIDTPIPRENRPDLLLYRKESIEAYLVCLDLATGEYKWSRYLGGMLATTFDAIGASKLDPPASPLVYADGFVYVMTNMGSLSAIDPYDGSLAWIDYYSSDKTDRSKWFVGNPVIAEGGKVFTIPADNQSLLIYEAGTGAEIKRIDLKQLANDPDLEEAGRSPLAFNTLLAVDGNQVILLGRLGNEVQALSFDWTNYTAADPCIAWATAAIDHIDGRCFVTGDSVFVAATRRLSRVNRSTGIIDENYPPNDRDWDTDAGEGPGNVLVIANHVIVAGAKQVTVYSAKPAGH
jgi:outer membrane protein assembly factor BamB